jgi:membrane-associated phospholipid phosphatase
LLGIGRTVGRVSIAMSVILPAGATRLGAQVDSAPSASWTAPLADSGRRATAPVLTWRDAALAGGFVAGTAILLAADRPIQRTAQTRGLQHTPVLRDAADGFSALADPGTLILAGSTYLAGLVTHHRRVAALGLHVGEALVMAGAITEGLKGIAGRARPVVDPTRSLSFRFGRGFSDDHYASFPSGEATLAFAAASAITAETARWGGSGAGAVGPVSYGLATGVALSRIYKNEHWASDVAAGAGIGVLSGLVVVRLNAAHPRNWVDRWLLPAAVTPTAGGGVSIMWSVR